MTQTREFKNLTMDDVAIAGGKGASLGEMTWAGIPVPPGFVVLAESFEQFLTENELHDEIQAQLDKVNKDEMESVEGASEIIQSLIESAKMPAAIEQEIEAGYVELDRTPPNLPLKRGGTFVAVRSSATAEDGSTASWAGELDSFLNTTKETLLENVKKCWASLFTPRAIFYGFEKGFHQSRRDDEHPNDEQRTATISVAVVVQKMVNSEISGIAFSVHPVTEDRNQLIIEAGYGLGEAIVSGSITPDNYVVDKRDWSIIDSYISEQGRALYRKEGGGNEWKTIQSPKSKVQKLSKEKILELAKLVVRIEEHYKFPCDIEWAMESDKIYVVQSRPITTLSS